MYMIVLFAVAWMLILGSGPPPVKEQEIEAVSTRHTPSEERRE